MNLNSIPAFHDNYIWVLNNEAGDCLIVDPGEARPVLQAIDDNGWQPQAILLTHHHHDHVGGVSELLAHYPNLTVYGPQETADKGTNRIVDEGDKIKLLGMEFCVIATPGHTLGHISYYSFPYLFCGDTMFSGGCGRLFEGTPAQMYASFKKIDALPEASLICCAHEYTLNNLKFSVTILPEDSYLNEYYLKVKELRAKNQRTVPTTLQTERLINLFLRINNIDLINKINQELTSQQPEARFAWLRAQKDIF